MNNDDNRKSRGGSIGFALAALILTGAWAGADPPSNGVHQMPRYVTNSGDVVAPQVALCTANGADLGLRIVPNVAEAVLSPSIHANGQYRLRVGVLAPRTDPPSRQYDCNRDGIPDICAGGSGDPVLPDVPEVPKNRYISLRMTAQNAGRTAPLPHGRGSDQVNAAQLPSAIRVTLTWLHHPDPPNLPQFPAPSFSLSECGARWVGPPSNCQESEVQHTTFKCATIQCAPAYVDWDAALSGATLHVTGAEIVPSSEYLVQSIPSGANTADEAAYSTPLVIATARWGDIVVPFQQPSPASLSQPNISDIAAIVDKFKDLSSAIIKAQAQLQPGLPNPSAPVDIRDIASSVDAFKSLAYPFSIPPSCP